VLISDFQFVSVVEDEEIDDDQNATGSRGKPTSINCRTNTASSGHCSKLNARVAKLAKAISEASGISSPPTSAKSGSGNTENLPTFVKAKWCLSFLPTLYARLGSAKN
jgi:hypothetical protein